MADDTAGPLSRLGCLLGLLEGRPETVCAREDVGAMLPGGSRLLLRRGIMLPCSAADAKLLVEEAPDMLPALSFGLHTTSTSSARSKRQVLAIRPSASLQCSTCEGSWTAARRARLTPSWLTLYVRPC